MLTEWALLGQGIALKPLWEVAGHLRAGRLEPVLPDFPPEPAVLAVLYPHRRLLPAKVKAFADFMVEQRRARPPDVPAGPSIATRSAISARGLEPRARS